MGYSSNETVIRLFNDFETLEEECRIGAQRRAAVRYRRDMLKTEQENLTRERAGLGLFAGKRRKEIDERLVQIDGELKGLK